MVIHATVYNSNYSYNIYIHNMYNIYTCINIKYDI